MVQAGWPGRIIDGRYAVEAVIGSGGMGLVLKARHTFTGAEVALKVLKPELELDPEIQMRFLAEARAPTAIGHPGIVSVVDAGKAPDGLLYLVMELLVGQPLRIPMARGELAAPDVRRILLELLEVLGVAHVRGFVHRDLKPENVFLAGPARSVKLLDFGIAKVLDTQLARVRTATGATLGTPAYMAPEQFHDPSGVDARADLWALGVMAYEMLSGRLPFHATTTQAMLVAVATKEPDPIRVHLPNVPPAIEGFFQRALSRELPGRFATAAEMAQALAALPLGGAAAPVSGPASGATMSTGPGAWATPSPIASVSAPGVSSSAMSVPGALPAATARSAYVPPPPVPTAPPPAVQTPPSDRRKWVIGLGLASAVSIAVIVIAVISTRPKASPIPGPSPGSGSGPTGSAVASAAGSAVDRTIAPDAALVAVAVPVDAAVVAVDGDEARDTAIKVGLLDRTSKGPRDAPAGARPRAPVDAGAVAVAAVRPDAANGPEAEDPEEICIAGCQAVEAKCGNVTSSCVNDCKARPKFRDCLRQPIGSCMSISVCGMYAICGAGVLQGTGTCKAAAECQLANCPLGNIGCGCRCAASMSPTHAYALTMLDACVLTCGGDQQCMQARCSVAATTCATQ